MRRARELWAAAVEGWRRGYHDGRQVGWPAVRTAWRRLRVREQDGRS